MLHATIFVNTTNTSALAPFISTDFQQIGTDRNVAPCRVMNAMVQQYRQYRYRKVTVQWIPSVGPASAEAGARVHMIYTDNSEHGANFHNAVVPFASAANRLAFIKGSRNVITFNAWERFTWNVPLTRRKPWFDVNTNDPALDINSYDRGVQGFVAQGYESVLATANLGFWKITFELELRGLDADPTAAA